MSSWPRAGFSAARGLTFAALLGACSTDEQGAPSPASVVLVADATSIKSYDPETGVGRELVAGLDAPSFVAADPVGRRLYWTTRSSLFSATLEGTNVVELRSDLDGGRGIAVDTAHGKLLWAEEGARRVRRSNFDGTEAEDVVTSLGAPWDVAMDATFGVLYLADPGFERVQAIDARGEGTPVDVVTGAQNPVGVAFDSGTRSLYFTSSGAGAIERSDLDGGNRESAIEGLADPIDVAFDVAGRKLYWTDLGGVLYRSEDDGTAPEVIARGLASPIGLAVY